MNGVSAPGDVVTLGEVEMGGELSDEELAALALAADPDAVLGPDAVSVWEVIDGPGCDGVGLLPGWYMPAAAANAEERRRWWKRPVALVLIASFLMVDALGLCITYGQLVIA